MYETFPVDFLSHHTGFYWFQNVFMVSVASLNFWTWMTMDEIMALFSSLSL